MLDGFTGAGKPQLEAPTWIWAELRSKSCSCDARSFLTTDELVWAAGTTGFATAHYRQIMRWKPLYDTSGERERDRERAANVFWWHEKQIAVNCSEAPRWHAALPQLAVSLWKPSMMHSGREQPQCKNVLFAQMLQQHQDVAAAAATNLYYSNSQLRRSYCDTLAGGAGIISTSKSSSSVGPPSAGEVCINICWQFSCVAAWKAMKAHTKRSLSPKHY